VVWGLQEPFPHFLMLLERFLQLLAYEVSLRLPFLAKALSAVSFQIRSRND
jgi:hypothetical protein